MQTSCKKAFEKAGEKRYPVHVVLLHAFRLTHMYTKLTLTHTLWSFEKDLEGLKNIIFPFSKKKYETKPQGIADHKVGIEGFKQGKTFEEYDQWNSTLNFQRLVIRNIKISSPGCGQHEGTKQLHGLPSVFNKLHLLSNNQVHKLHSFTTTLMTNGNRTFRYNFPHFE